MPKVNRESPEDAQKIINGFIADESARDAILSFLSNAIIFANILNHHNWNLNLDKNGGFVRFNVGQAYCIQISSTHVYILTLKEYIRKKLAETQLDVKFIGYDGKKDVVMSDLENVPDMLTKVPDSVVCSIEHQNLASALPYLEEANRKFIVHAIQNTTLLPKMIRAHSTGFITYLSQYCKKRIPNPSYIFDEEESYYDLTHEREQRKVGGGFGNSETNRKVEQAAIAYVTDDYKKNGWLVKSIESEKRGFDLLCTKDKAQEHVEVKGVQGDIVFFNITSGEVKQSQTDKHFVLCVVTSALTVPKLHKFTAKEFQEKFVLETVSYRASLKQG
jgi:hypothetical protein